MKKQLNTTAVINELKGASVFFQSEPKRITTPPSREETEDGNGESKREAPPAIEHLIGRSISCPVSQSTDQPTRQSANRLVNPLVDRSTSRSIDQSPILGRPKAFYLTQKQDDDLDVAVEKLNRKIGAKINQKIDRSVLVRLLLEESDITSEQTIGRLASRLVGRLISRLTS